MNDFEIIRPGLFTVPWAADGRRHEFDAHNEALLMNGCRVETVFIGDSITHQWEVRAYFKRQAGLLINRGIGGDTSSGVRRRLAADALQLRPVNAVVLVGINNAQAVLPGAYRYDRKPVISPETAVAAYLEDMEEIVSQLVSAGVHLYICSLTPTDFRHPRQPMWDQFVRDANTALRNLCDAKRVLFVPFYDAMVLSDGITANPDLFYDGIHPNGRGYAVMADVLRRAAPDVF